MEYWLPRARVGAAFGFGAQAQGHVLRERRQRKLAPRAGDTQRVVDEWPDDSIDISTGERIAEASGVQTNNPGYPGFSSRGFLVGGTLSVSLVY